MRTRNKNKQTLKARENAGDQVRIGCSFESDWSRGCCDISGPITSQGRSKREKLCITFDTQLKGVLMHHEDFSHREKIDAKNCT